LFPPKKKQKMRIYFFSLASDKKQLKKKSLSKDSEKKYLETALALSQIVKKSLSYLSLKKIKLT